MIEKGPRQKSVKIRPITFHNNDPINAQLANTGKILVVLKPTSPLHAVGRSLLKESLLSEY